jgi:hypothetical protein
LAWDKVALRHRPHINQTLPHAIFSMSQQDPLWKLRHALAGVAIALLLSVLTAAWAGRVMGDWLGGDYGMRSAIYGALLLYVVIGAGVLFAKVAQHETQPLSAGRVALWLASLWLWPALLFAGKRGGGGGGGSDKGA